MRKMITLSLVVAVALAVGGCKDSTGPSDANFTATITGDLELELEGEAIFGVTTSGGIDRWMIFLTAGQFMVDPDWDMIGISREASGTSIGVGTHTIVDAADDDLEAEDVAAAYMLGRHNGGSLGVFGSVSGTLTITAATSNVVTGNFSFSATMHAAVGDDARDLRDLMVTGSFTAEPGTIPAFAAN
ncbi:hypothetical protein ACFL3B_03825 [Gemmatimonadota bacterium]